MLKTSKNVLKNPIILFKTAPSTGKFFNNCFIGFKKLLNPNCNLPKESLYVLKPSAILFNFLDKNVNKPKLLEFKSLPNSV